MHTKFSLESLLENVRVGRPRKRRENHIKTNLIEVGCEKGGWN
jgi:hypothetical protein